MSRAGKALRRTLIEEVSVPVEVAAAALGIRRTSASEAIRNKELPHIKIGRRVSVPTAVLRKMLQIPEPRNP
jgi:plasmid maintenance system antidote protein VapI